MERKWASVSQEKGVNRVKEIEEAYEELAIESIFDEQPDKKCIIQELSKPVLGQVFML